MTKNNKQMTASEIEPGEVYDVYTSEDGKKVEKMIQNASVTSTRELRSKSTGRKRLTVRGVNYAITMTCLYFQMADRLTIGDYAEDEVTLAG